MRPGVYWGDFLGSAAIGWGTFALAFALPPTTLAYWAFSLASAVAFLRAAYFVHELSHRTSKELPGFHAAWNVLIGIPILVPSFMMWPHREHHRPATYGTTEDPEYAPVPAWSLGRIAGAIAIYAVVPGMLAARFAFAPIGLLVPAARRHAISKVSTADIDHHYVRPPIPAEDRPRFLLLEVACFLFAWAAIGATLMGWIPLWLHGHRWLVMAIALMLNHARLLAIHRYEGDWSARSLEQQTLDTWTMGPESPLTELVAPVGSRFHALHHELPGLPYHALPAAHRTLMEELPADHPYRETVIDGFVDGWRRVLARARAERRGEERPGESESPPGAQL
ncbi:MAG: fatty acid desaturase [Deltaproteobacteria bacterium]|nr:fatty acid desaturase [Deltaproteobacteria bacterium]